MPKSAVAISFEIFETIESLPADLQMLALAAQDITHTAYAPYSNFKVGASVLLANKQVVSGSNQENSAYPSGLCAERVALFSTAVQYPHQKIAAIAIAATKSYSFFLDCAPCGACREVMMEYERKQQSPIAVLFQAAQGKYYLVASVKDLLPFNFVM